MAYSIIGTVTATRWHLPLKSPADQGMQDRMECGAIDAGCDLVDRARPGAQRGANLSNVDSAGLADARPSNADATDTDGAVQASVADFEERWRSRG